VGRRRTLGLRNWLSRGAYAAGAESKEGSGSPPADGGAVRLDAATDGIIPRAAGPALRLFSGSTADAPAAPAPAAPAVCPVGPCGCPRLTPPVGSYANSTQMAEYSRALKCKLKVVLMRSRKIVGFIPPPVKLFRLGAEECVMSMVAADAVILSNAAAKSSCVKLRSNRNASPFHNAAFRSSSIFRAFFVNSRCFSSCLACLSKRMRFPNARNGTMNFLQSTACSTPRASAGAAA